ncbi:hypothetical protein GHO25_17730 [Pseudomonas sp. FSL R10-1350]|uniref:Uncharacterized protein n=1 Tax=Pseudomonas helleri TaxID=1608996 RepID=A0A6A7YNS6_9PSED|nr:hypothetical protein [Pseudomonas helleri]MQT49680.1 hypothetical protein [Pseudomonas helleri]MQU64956.1 hypothetical protein [Pseudomonas sp. FSL R10-1350]
MACSAKELAEQLVAPLGSVKVWLRRGMERLRGPGPGARPCVASDCGAH